MSSESATFDIQRFLKDLPNLPGVYRHIAADGEVLYVGKAKDLKKRVSQYFQRCWLADVCYLLQLALLPYQSSEQ